MKTWLRIKNNFVVGKMTHPTRPGLDWIEGTVDFISLPGIQYCYQYDNGNLVSVNSKVINDFYFQKIRNQRDNLLKDSDWTQLSDSPMAEGKKNQWKVYRQQLRDLPDTISNPKLPVVWPTQPDPGDQTG
jgi:hypothetical protein